MPFSEELKYLGALSQVDSDFVTIDDVNIQTLVREIDADFQYYQELQNTFFNPLMESVSVPSKVVRYYQSGTQPFTEAGRATSELTQYDFIQDIGHFEESNAIELTKRALQVMTSEEIANYTQAKLSALQRSKFKELQRTIFANEERQVVDSSLKYQSTVKPFFNDDTSISAPPVTGYKFKPGDLQHYNAVTELTAEAIRTNLIDKLRHHGLRQMEIWQSDFDYSLEQLPEFIPAANQIGRDLQVQTAGPSSSTQRQLSPWEGLQGFIHNVPVVKTSMIPEGYLVAVSTGGGAGRTPFLSRKHPLGLDGLQVEVKEERFPLSYTMLSDSWGFSAHNRGAIAVLQVGESSYTAPTF